MKEKKRMLFVSDSIFLLFALIFLSACGKEEEPAEEETWLSKLDQLAVETVIENSEMNGSLVKEGYVEVVIDKIYCGAFSKEKADEIFVECRLSGIPVRGAYDSRACFLLDADTFKISAYKEFDGDHVTLERLQTATGQSRILFMRYEDGMEQMQGVELWGVCNGEWVELPTGIEEFIPEENKELVTGINGTEAKIGDNFCYLAGDRLVITYEEDGWTMFLNENSVPSELIAVLKWDPYEEKFVLDTNIEQPAIQQK